MICQAPRRGIVLATMQLIGLEQLFAFQAASTQEHAIGAQLRVLRIFSSRPPVDHPLEPLDPDVLEDGVQLQSAFSVKSILSIALRESVQKQTTVPTYQARVEEHQPQQMLRKSFSTAG